MTILAVDDEDFALECLIDRLKEACPDSTILSTQDADEALKVAGELSIDLLVTDLTMWGMDGDELAIRIHERYPKTEILFETGEDKRTLMERGIQIERVLWKLVAAAEVIQKLEDVHSLPAFEIKIMEQKAESPGEILQQSQETKSTWLQNIKKKFQK